MLVDDKGSRKEKKVSTFKWIGGSSLFTALTNIILYFFLKGTIPKEIIFFINSYPAVLLGLFFCVTFCIVSCYYIKSTIKISKNNRKNEGERNKELEQEIKQLEDELKKANQENMELHRQSIERAERIKYLEAKINDLNKTNHIGGKQGSDHNIVNMR